ncbi:hypothetical protein VN12_14485 [Pirellula sp. SH-Sr6A]|uniref:hypothetical protein n=1 Tax=Pirellula sp. SH-Sr6A TaxID=1632865 RepID=UPI00078B47EA|nr:hypothetical protein [Pirellula sp. SH-Sr6A]AMV33331.1 hypothetical protein VN12_14485 [Pirellula sp. SH-Sr6A]
MTAASPQRSRSRQTWILAIGLIVVSGGLLTYQIRKYKLLSFPTPEVSSGPPGKVVPFQESMSFLKDVKHRFSYTMPAYENLYDEEIERLAQPWIQDMQELLEEVDKVEARRLEEDPHLKAALSDLWKTPFGHPEARTTKGRRRHIEGVVEGLVQDYREVGLDSEEFRAQAAPIFLAFIKRIWLDRQNTATDEEFALFEQSKDPLGLYLRAHVHSLRKEKEKLPEVRMLAHQSLTQRKSPPYLRILIEQSFIDPKAEWKDENELAGKTLAASYADIFSDPQSSDGLLFSTLGLLAQCSEIVTAAGYSDVCREILARKEPACRPWSQTFSLSLLFEMISEKYRASRPYSEIPPLELEVFERFSDLNTRIIVKTWTLNPNHPDVLRQLMSSQLISGATGRPMDVWFRHALSIEFDNVSFYNSYLTSCMSRWGGSNRKLVWLASMMINTLETNPDSKVPLYAWNPLSIATDEEALEDESLKTAMVKSVQKLVQFMQSQNPAPKFDGVNPKGIALFCSLLWGEGHFENLSWLMKQYADLCTEESFCDYEMSPVHLRAYSNAYDAKPLPEWKTLAERLIRSKDALAPDEFVETEAMVAKLEKDALEDSTREAIAISRSILSVNQSFLSGKPTRIPFDAEGALWIASERLKPSNESTLEYECDSNGGGFYLTPRVQIEIPFRVEISVQNLVDVSDEQGMALHVGGSGLNRGETSAVIRFVPFRSAVEWSFRPNERFETVNESVAVQNPNGAPFQLAIEVWSTHCVGYVNGEIIANSKIHSEIPKRISISRPWVAASRVSPSQNAPKIRIKDVTVVRLQGDKEAKTELRFGESNVE